MPASASTLATRLVVVVLPCVPATAMPCFRRISSASIIARGTTGILRARAAATSGLSSFTALEITTASALATLLRGMAHDAPSRPGVFRRCVAALSSRSEPLTSKPRLSSTSAMPLMPEPPMPTKWMCLTLCFMPASLHRMHVARTALCVALRLGRRCARALAPSRSSAFARQPRNSSRQLLRRQFRVAASAPPRRARRESAHCASGDRPPRAGTAPARWRRRPRRVRRWSRRRRGRSPDRDCAYCAAMSSMNGSSVGLDAGAAVIRSTSARCCAPA